jgi:eukaryotic-like serine/threonine-protein kinase
MLGRALVFETRYDEAQELLEQAVAIQEHVFGAVHPRVASALNDLGNVALKRKQMYRDAIGRFSEAQSPDHRHCKD